MHHASPRVVVISKLAFSARLPRVTASKQKRSASVSTQASAPISSRIVLTQSAPWRRAVSSTTASMLSASASSCMADLDSQTDAGIERLRDERRPSLDLVAIGRRHPGEAAYQRA